MRTMIFTLFVASSITAHANINSQTQYACDLIKYCTLENATPGENSKDCPQLKRVRLHVYNCHGDEVENLILADHLCRLEAEDILVNSPCY